MAQGPSIDDIRGQESAAVEVEKPKKERKAKAPKKPTLAMLSRVPVMFSEMSGARELCVKCGRGATEQAGYKSIPKGYTGRLLLVFGQAPKEDEYRLILGYAKQAGYDHKDVAWTSTVRCSDSEPSMEQIRCCRPFVLRVLDVLRPKLVIALGPSASRSLTNLGTMTNVTKLRGRPLEIQGYDIPAYVTYEPSTVINGGLQYKEYILEDLRRASEERLEYPKDQVPEVLSSVSVDTEYAPDGTLLTLGMASLKDAIAVETTDMEYMPAVGMVESVGKHGAYLVGHSVTGDLDHLIKLGAASPEWVTGAKTRDSLLLSRMKDENRAPGGYELESLLTSKHNVTPWKHLTNEYDKADATTWPVDLRKERCRLDAWASGVVVDDTLQDVVNERQPVELTHRIAMSLHRIELAGVAIDRKKFTEFELNLRAEAEQYKDKLMKLAMSHGMTSFSPTVDADIRELLFNKLKLPVVKKTKKGNLASVDKTTLEQYSGRPEVDPLIAFNKADKALSTNITGVSPLITPVDERLGWLPVHINPLGAKTGRRSSYEPNMQNWPPKMRELVVSRYPGGCILEFDYKALEVFIISFVSQDEKLYDYFANRGGYIGIAKDLWKTEVKKGTVQYKGTKGIVLGTHYNKQAKNMAHDLWLQGVKFSADYEEHERQTGRLRAKYLDMFPGLKKYIAQQKNYVRRYQSAVTLTGRVRHLPHNGPETEGYWKLENQAINFPIQSLAADVTGSALIDCEQVICDYVPMTLMDYHILVLTKDWIRWPVPLIINEIHDSLVFDLPWGVDAPQTKEVATRLKAAMEELKTLRTMFPKFEVPLVAEMKCGLHWASGD